jgi:hypothetical protein
MMSQTGSEENQSIYGFVDVWDGKFNKTFPSDMTFANAFSLDV